MQKIKLLFGALAIGLSAVGFAWAQDAAKPVRLRNGTAVKGFIGGESHSSYVIRARKGQMMVVSVMRRVKKGGNFNLSVTTGKTFDDSSAVESGKQTSGKTRMQWKGRVLATGNYYFSTTAYPDAHYTIRVTLKRTSGRSKFYGGRKRRVG